MKYRAVYGHPKVLLDPWAVVDENDEVVAIYQDEADAEKAAAIRNGEQGEPQAAMLKHATYCQDPRHPGVCLP